MPRLRPDELDPEIRHAIEDLPDFIFAADTVPVMRQNAVFSPVPAPDIERVELTTQPGSEVNLSVLRRTTPSVTSRCSIGCTAAGW
jgi:hypothetical protein